MGRDGRDGRDGEKGEKGELGMIGPPGPLRDRGLPGSMGISGPRGAPGGRGEPGEPGGKGVHGDPGLRGPQGVQGPQGGGVTYTRWGRTSCPTGQETELLYSGRAAGSPLQNSGGAANYLCLPDNPDHLSSWSGVQGHSHITGVDYATYSFPGLFYAYTRYAPCAVCYASSRSAVVMIPAKTQCPGMNSLFYGLHTCIMYALWCRW